MRILIACDSYKDALSALEVCRAIGRGIAAASTHAECRLFPMSDGGEGLGEALSYHLGLRQTALEVSDPLFRRITACYGISEDGSVAFIEMAQASGLQLLTPAERNPMHTTTYGVGELIRHVISCCGARRIVVGLGGSATNDAGIGMAQALGFSILDDKGRAVQPVGRALKSVAGIIPPTNWPLNIQYEAMCDVTNPLYGPQGAAYVYSPQKGASPAEVATLDEGLRHIAGLSAHYDELAQQPGAGAAGGLGFGLTAFLGATLRSGIDLLMDLTGFDAQIDWADVVITGEGRLDGQSSQGKLVSGISRRALQKQKPVIALCGALDATPSDLTNMGITAAFSITPKPCTLEQAIAYTARNLEFTAFQVGRVLCCRL